MSTTPTRRPSTSDDRVRGLILIGAMVALMWVVEAINAITNYTLSADGGIRPRHLDGLDGVLFAPFLHASWSHLIGNTIPFLILGGVIALSGLARTILVTATIAVVGGLGTWLIGPENTNHVGASGLVFGFAAYLLGRGIVSRSLLHLAIGVVVAVVWGGTLVSGLVPQDGISWQGHLFGAAGGFLAAYWFGRAAAARPPRKAAPAAGPAARGQKTPEQLLEELKGL